MLWFDLDLSLDHVEEEVARREAWADEERDWDRVVEGGDGLSWFRGLGSRLFMEEEE